MRELHVGFTGTRRGLTDEQQEALVELLGDLAAREEGVRYALHHGDCVGADEDAHGIAEEGGWRTVLHPGEDARGESPHRAYCDGDVTMDALPYGQRNMNIVAVTVMLIACPGSPERRRSGTWSTVRAAQRMGRPVFLIPPDGDVRVNISNGS